MSYYIERKIWDTSGGKDKTVYWLTVWRKLGFWEGVLNCFDWKEYIAGSRDDESGRKYLAESVKNFVSGQEIKNSVEIIGTFATIEDVLAFLEK